MSYMSSLRGFWYGQVVDRGTGQYSGEKDNTKTGACKVRITGLDKDDLPAKECRWSQVMLPITSASISGVGASPNGLVEGSWVIGIWFDGEDSEQCPLIIGSLPHIQQKKRDRGKETASNKLNMGK
jgi:hypothetical protein